MSKKKRIGIAISATIFSVAGIVVDAIILENKWILFASFLCALCVVTQVKELIAERKKTEGNGE